MLRVSLCQLGSNVVHLADGIGDAQPHMRILAFLILQELNILGSINDLQVFVLVDDLVQEGLHAGTVGNKGIRLVQGFHVVSGELIIMQAAGLWLGHVDDLYAVHALGDIGGSDIDRIKGCNNAELAVSFLAIICGAVLPAARQQGGGEQQDSGKKIKYFFHEKSPYCVVSNILVVTAYIVW